MRLHLPKPLHGWRQLAGEVGIIVVGVLIALGAQQLADDARWQREVVEFRASIDKEIAGDLGTYEYRMGQNACVTRRLAELEQWLQGWRDGRSPRLTGPIGMPMSLSLGTSVWGSREASVMSHMPMNERLAYAQLYDEFANNETHRLDERAAWLELSEYDGATDLDHRDLMRLQGLITRSKLRNARITTNAEGYMKVAGQLGIKSEVDLSWQAPDPELCRPILRDAAEYRT